MFTVFAVKPIRIPFALNELVKFADLFPLLPNMYGHMAIPRCIDTLHLNDACLGKLEEGDKSENK